MSAHLSASEAAAFASFAPPDAVPLCDVRRILVIKLRHHGDVLLSAPVFSALKKAAPHAAIDALVYADTAEMLTQHPDIDRVLTVDRNWKKQGLVAQLRGELGLLQQLRSPGYDLVVHLTEHWRGAWLVRLTGARWSVAPKRNGNKRWKKSFTHIVGFPHNALRHMVETNLDAVRRIGIQPAPDERRVVLVPGAEAEASVEARLAALGLDKGAFIHIHPASRWFFKCWPAPAMAETIRRLQAAGHRVLLTGAPGKDEQAMIAAIQALLPQPVPSLAGQLSLKELAALTARARLFLGVDSAPMHIAAAMGTPVVVLFGPSGDRQWGPWQAPQRVITSRHSCRPCGIDGCGGGKQSDCLVSLSPEQVCAAIDELLAETAA